MSALLNQNKARKVEIKEKRQQDVDDARCDVFGDSDDEEDDQVTTEEENIGRYADISAVAGQPATLNGI